jgi:hypothetical protein
MFSVMGCAAEQLIPLDIKAIAARIYEPTLRLWKNSR